MAQQLRKYKTDVVKSAKGDQCIASQLIRESERILPFATYETKGHKQEFYRDVGSSASSSVPDTPTARLRRLLPTAWGIIRPYWASEDRWAAWGLLLVVVVLSLGMVYINVLFNQWNNAFYTALQDKNQTVFLKQLIRVCWLVGIFIFLAVYQLYLNQMLQIRWRRWLTERYLRDWLADGAYYRMQLLARETDNPDQRIAEDVNLLISGSLDLLVGALRALVNLIAFVAILWGLSGTLNFSLGWFSITLPGYMVWIASPVRHCRHLAHPQDWSAAGAAKLR